MRSHASNSAFFIAARSFTMCSGEKQSGQPLTLGDALSELLADITEAASTIGTILQAGDRRQA